MWDDVVIGKGDHGFTASRVFEIEGNDHISQNSVSFWISDLILDTSIIIFKDTKIGQKLQKMIDNKATLEEIDLFLDTVVLRSIKTDLLRKKMLHALETAFKAGKEARSKELRTILGIEDFQISIQEIYYVE